MKNKYGILFDGASFGPKKTHTLNLNEMEKAMFNPVTVRNTLLQRVIWILQISFMRNHTQYPI